MTLLSFAAAIPTPSLQIPRRKHNLLECMCVSQAIERASELRVHTRARMRSGVLPDDTWMDISVVLAVLSVLTGRGVHLPRKKTPEVPRLFFSSLPWSSGNMTLNIRPYYAH
jgi:hypothetical protein